MANSDMSHEELSRVGDLEEREGGVLHGESKNTFLDNITLEQIMSWRENLWIYIRLAGSGNKKGKSLKFKQEFV